jgi:hypothetical protein
MRRKAQREVTSLHSGKPGALRRTSLSCRSCYDLSAFLGWRFFDRLMLISQFRFPYIPSRQSLDCDGRVIGGDGHDTRSIQDYLGHKDIRHTVRYTELSPKPFRDFWRD